MGREGGMRDGERGRNEGWGEREVGPYPSHCSHVRPLLIGWFVVSLQEEDGRTDGLWG